MKDKIIQMLSNGIPQNAVAKACGVTDAYVSQLMSDEDIRAQVTNASIKDVEKGIKVDTLIEDIEEAALERMKSLLPFITRPADAARIFQTVNSAVKRVPDLTGQRNESSAPLVQINISSQAALSFKLSSDKQVVEIDGRSMATLPARELVKRLDETRQSRPKITDASTATQLLDRIERNDIPSDSLAHVL